MQNRVLPYPVPVLKAISQRNKIPQIYIKRIMFSFIPSYIVSAAGSLPEVGFPLSADLINPVSVCASGSRR